MQSVLLVEYIDRYQITSINIMQHDSVACSNFSPEYCLLLLWIVYCCQHVTFKVRT